MNNWLEKIIDLASITNNLRFLEEELGRIARGAGFDWFIYLHVRPGGSRFVSNASRVFQDTYKKDNHLENDPLVALAKAELRPVHWEITELRRRSRREGLPFLAAARQAEFVSGLTMPAGTAFGQLALLTWISRTPGTAAAAVIDDVLAASAVAQLHAAFQRVHTRSSIATPVELTAKQALCLRWSAEGKSMRAIATLEEMTYSTVAFHLLAARRTLDALSLPQATAIATKLRLI